MGPAMGARTGSTECVIKHSVEYAIKCPIGWSIACFDRMSHRMFHRVFHRVFGAVYGPDRPAGRWCQGDRFQNDLDRAMEQVVKCDS